MLSLVLFFCLFVLLPPFRSLSPTQTRKRIGGEGHEGVGSRECRGDGGGSGNAPTKKSGENHESKPLIRVAAGSIGPTDADRWVSMETRICPLGLYVPTSSGCRYLL